MNLPTETATWTRIRMAGLTRLVNAPLAQRWQWESVMEDGRKRPVLRSPRGTRWRFKLNRGAWLQRMAVGDAGPP